MSKISVFVVVCSAVALYCVAQPDAAAQVAPVVEISALKGAPKASPARAKQVGGSERLRHEIWGQTTYGEGYVYGPTNRRSGMTVVDIDLDGDNDFVFPSSISSPELMRNLGSNNAFYPGGSTVIDMDPLPEFTRWDLNMDFGDLTGDGLPDLVAVVNFEDEPGTFDKQVALYTNDGPRANPSFTFDRIIASSSQGSDEQRAMWVALGDINGDGLLDLFIGEAWIFEPERQHRVYMGINQGDSTAPLFPSYVEVTELSDLLPPRLEGKALQAAIANPAELPSEPGKSMKAAKGTAFSYNLGDIALYDWDYDGLLDFMFYDRSHGLTLVRNIGTPTEPAWNNVIGTDAVTYIYDHTVIDGVDLAEGTFAIRENPDSVLPGVEWLRDIYVSSNSRLKDYRFFTDEGDGGAYRINQENAVAFSAGQGDVDFWDFDSDGDLDMFRTGISGAAETNLILFENKGAPYAPAWAEFESQNSLVSVPLNAGTADNDYRNDLFLFQDHDNDGQQSLFVQKLDGMIDQYAAIQSSTPGVPPSFNLATGDFVESVAFGDVVTAPRGFALHDFDGYSDGYSELITAYSFDGDSTIRVVDTYQYAFYIANNMDPSPAYYDLLDGTLPANFLPDPHDNSQPLDPLYLESMAAGDLNLDGRPDLVIAWSADSDFEDTELHYYINVAVPDHNNFEIPAFRFEYGGRLDEAYAVDHRFGRMPKMADIDGDGDDDLFVGHRYPDNHGTNLRSYLRFHRNVVDSGLDIFRTRLVANQAINLGDSDIDPGYEIVLNGSGGSLVSDTVYETGNNAPAIDILQSANLERNQRIFLDVLPPVGPNESKAIIIVGDTADDPLYNTFSTLAGFAYYVLGSEGLPAENIRFYADTDIDGDGDGTNDVIGKPSLASLEDSITNWAQGSEKLLVYLVDHGQRDRFRMSGTEYLEAADLDAWYDQLQNVPLADRTVITTLIDTCEAGSFIDNLALTKSQIGLEKGVNNLQRISMTSSGVGPVEGVALFDQSQYISFSLNFWFNIFNGKDYGQAYDEAKISIEAVNPLQVPQIDSDGNGVPNQGGDSALAFGQRPGANFDIQVPGVFIGEITPDQAVNSNSATLGLGNVVSPFPVEGAGALIVPPNFQRPSLNNDDEQPISGLDFIEFTFNSDTERWEGTYDGFDQGGLFQVQYFVRAGGQFHASPRIGFVDRVNLADAWESDNAPEDANWIPINSVQGHNFDRDGDEDWVLFAPLPGQKATIGVINPGPNNQAVVELYLADDVATNGVDGATAIRTETSATPGEDLVFEQNFTEPNQYLLRIKNADAAISGEGTSYLLLVAIGTGGADLIPTTLIVAVREAGTNAPIVNANVMFDGRNAGRTSRDGIVQMPVDIYGQYEIASEKAGFVQNSTTVRVNNLIEEATITLTPEGGEGEGEGEGEPEPIATVAQRLLDNFDAADGNSDGKLTFAEASAGSAGMTQAQFNQIDANNDGLLTRSELNKITNPTVGCSAPDTKAFGGFTSDVMLVLLTAASLAWASLRIRKQSTS